MATKKKQSSAAVSRATVRRIVREEMALRYESLDEQFTRLLTVSDRVQRRLQFLDEHVTAQNVRSLTIRMGQIEHGLNEMQGNIKNILQALHP